MNIKFESLTNDKISEAIELCDLVFEEKTDLEFAKKRFEENQNDKNSLYIVGYTEDGKMVAHLRIQFIETMFTSMATYAVLNHVCVHPDYRRRGIATKMLEYTEEICKERNCISLKLWSYNYRISSHELYKSFEFVPVDATFYSKELRKEEL